MTDRYGQREREGRRWEEAARDYRYERDEDDPWRVEARRGDYDPSGREAYNPPGGGRGYGRGDYGQARENEIRSREDRDEGTWSGRGRGYGYGDYPQGSRRSQMDWERSSNEPPRRGYGYGDYGQRMGRSQPNWDEGHTEPVRRGYGYGDYGQNRGDFGQAGQNQRRGDDDWDTARVYAEWWAIPGEFTGRGPQGWQRSKERILEDVCERLMQHGQIDASNLQVNVENNEVVLTGTVNTRREKRLAEEVAESVSGVHDVQNQLRVQQESSQQSRPHTLGNGHDTQQPQAMGEGRQPTSRRR